MPLDLPAKSFTSRESSPNQDTAERPSLRLVSLPADASADANESLIIARERSETDEALLGMFVSSRNRDAFGAIVSRYERLVMGVALRQVGDRHRAEDVFQATFVVLAEQAERIRCPESLASWLHGTARRIGLRVLRDSQRHSAMTSDHDPGPAMETPVLEAMQRAFEWQTFDTELANLPDRLRLPLVLHYLEGLTAQEVARRLRLTTATVEGRLKKGRTELRRRLIRHGIGFGIVLAVFQMTQQIAAASTGSLTHATAEASVAWMTHQPLHACTATAAKLAGKELIAMSTMKTTTLVTVAVVLCLGGGILGRGLAGGLTRNSKDVTDGGSSVIRTVIKAEATANGLATPDLLLAQAEGGSEPARPGQTPEARPPSPEAPATEASSFNPSNEEMWVLVDRDGRLMIDGEGSRLTADALSLRLRSKPPRVLSLSVSPETPYAVVRELTKNVRQAGIFEVTVSVATQPPAPIPGGASEPAAEGSPLGGQPVESTPRGAAARSFRNLSESRKKIEEVLTKGVFSHRYEVWELKDLPVKLSEDLAIPVQIDWKALTELSIPDNEEIAIGVVGAEEFPVVDALDLLLADVAGEPLDYIIRHGVLTITTREKSDSYLETVIYDLRHLPQFQGDGGYDFVVEYLLYGTSGNWSLRDAFGFGGAEGTTSATFEPGEASITQIPGGMSIRQTQRVHREIEALLKLLEEFSAGGGVPAPPTAVDSGMGSGQGFF